MNSILRRRWLPLLALPAAWVCAFAIVLSAQDIEEILYAALICGLLFPMGTASLLDPNGHTIGFENVTVVAVVGYLTYLALTVEAWRRRSGRITLILIMLLALNVAGCPMAITRAEKEVEKIRSLEFEDPM